MICDLQQARDTESENTTDLSLLSRIVMEGNMSQALGDKSGAPKSPAPAQGSSFATADRLVQLESGLDIVRHNSIPVLRDVIESNSQAIERVHELLET